MSEQEAAAQTAVILNPFSAGQLARISGRTKDAAKKWKAGERCPNLASIINLARQIDALGDWLIEEIRNPVTPNQKQALIAAARLILQQEAQTGTGELAARARAQISRGER